MNYTFINKITGWTVFAIASIVYLLTIEDTASLWDCGEYITAAYKLEVGHPPGAPLYMLLGRLFSFFSRGVQTLFFHELGRRGSKLAFDHPASYHK